MGPTVGPVWRAALVRIAPTLCAIKRQISGSLALVNSPSLHQMCVCVCDPKTGRAASLARKSGLEWFPLAPALSHLPPDPDVLTRDLCLLEPDRFSLVPVHVDIGCGNLKTHFLFPTYSK